MPNFHLGHELNMNFYSIARRSGHSNSSGHKECALNHRMCVCTFFCQSYSLASCYLCLGCIPVFPPHSMVNCINVWDKSRQLRHRLNKKTKGLKPLICSYFFVYILKYFLLVPCSTQVLLYVQYCILFSLKAFLTLVKIVHQMNITEYQILKFFVI